MSAMINILILSVAVFIVAHFIPGIRIKNYMTAVIVAVVYSLINFFIGWFLLFISLPLLLVTFGLFKLIINAFLLWITDKLISDFEIKDFFTTVVAALCITLVDSFIKWML
jgi:putative membrane protein